MKTRILIVFTILVLLLSNITDVFSLPSAGQAGHKSLNNMSIEIKKNVGDTGLTESLNQYGSTMSSSNISEDGIAGLYGALHFYDPTNQCGYLCLFPNAKDTANAFYKTGGLS